MEARGCKLPTEADRPELLHSAPRQLAIALLYWRVNPWSVNHLLMVLVPLPAAANRRVVGSQGVSGCLPGLVKSILSDFSRRLH